MSSHLLSKLTKRLREAGIPEPRLEAQLLLSLVTHRPRAFVAAGLVSSLLPEEEEALERLVQARERRMPLAYLRGTQEFYGLSFRVTQATLIPRPETELLVERGIAFLKQNPHSLFLDVGTGSGCIAITLLTHLPNAFGIASDISAQALAIAHYNATQMGVLSRLLLVRAHLLSGFKPHRFELIVSNPPYIPSAEVPTLQPEVREHEPLEALDGGSDGLYFHRMLIEQARELLRPGGMLLLEVALGQASHVKDLLAANGYTAIEVMRDLASIERAVSGLYFPTAQTSSPSGTTVPAHRSVPACL